LPARWSVKARRRPTRQLDASRVARHSRLWPIVKLVRARRSRLRLVSRRSRRIRAGLSNSVRHDPATGDTTANISAVTALFQGLSRPRHLVWADTIYIGAGAGASRIKVSDYTSTLAPPFTPGLTNTQWKFA
jgi:hypothetical protein